MWHFFRDFIEKSPEITGSPGLPLKKRTPPRWYTALDEFVHEILGPKMLGFWWLTHPEKCEFVIWDDDIPNLWKKMFQTTNQHIIFQKYIEK